MATRLPTKIMIALWLAVATAAPAGIVAAMPEAPRRTVTLTSQQEQWLESNRLLRVGIWIDSPPLAFIEVDGQPGLIIDLAGGGLRGQILSLYLGSERACLMGALTPEDQWADFYAVFQAMAASLKFK